MANGKKAEQNSPVMARLFEDEALNHFRARRTEFLRAQFLAWRANLLGELVCVHAELANETSDMARAMGDDARGLALALERARSELSLDLPKCVPAFLTVEPFFVPKPEGAK